MARKGLGHVLHKLNETPTETKTSIVEDINKACKDGITEAGAFSMTGITRQLRKMQTLAESDDFNRDQFFHEFHQLYSLVMAPSKRATGVFHPSQLLQGCARQMAFDLMRIAPTDEVYKGIGAELRRTFDVGTWYHIYMQNILFSLGLLEQAEVPVVNKKRYLNGSADGMFKEEVFGEKVVLEIKTMNSWTFSKAVFKPFEKHEFQASLYARELGAKKVLYLYINKDTSEIRDFLRPINLPQLEKADAKMNMVIKAVEGGELPKRSCKEKASDNALACPFATICFSKE